MKLIIIKAIIISFVLLFYIACYETQKCEGKNLPSKYESADKSENRPWYTFYIGDLLMVISIIVGARIIVYQINRQHKNDIEVQKENYREKLRIEIYQEFYKFLEKANNTADEAKMYAFLLTFKFADYIHQRQVRQNPSPVKVRAKEFSDLHFSAINAVCNLIKLIEKYEIVCLEFDIFKLAFNSALYNISKGFTPLYRFLLDVSPMDITDVTGNSKIFNVRVPTQDQMGELKELAKTFLDGHDELGGYLYDLNIELQKKFLSRLFNNKVKKRQPIDPNVKVITTDAFEIEGLRKYFEIESPWGIHQSQVKQNVRRDI